MSRNNSKLPLYVEYHVDFRNRVYWFNGDVHQDEVYEAIRAIEIMARTSNDPITIKISSFGGDPYTALGFYDYIKSLSNIHVITECVGMCMSAGTIMFLAGDERLMSSNSTFMAHTVSTASYGRAYELKGEAEECERLLDKFCDIYSEETNLTKAQWKRKIKFEDVYIDAEEAAKLGII